MRRVCLLYKARAYVYVRVHLPIPTSKTTGFGSDNTMIMLFDDDGDDDYDELQSLNAFLATQPLLRGIKWEERKKKN